MGYSSMLRATLFRLFCASLVGLSLSTSVPYHAHEPASAHKYSECPEIAVRREWRTLSESDRKSYLSAVKCIMQLTPLSNATVPGATNRYEDFVGVHSTRMTKVHFTGLFYPWHRYFVILYENHLHQCGYKGPQPYWDWELDMADGAFMKSPIFDAETGFGGNGDYVPGNVTHPAPGMTPLAHGDAPDRTGGGCVRDGPFNTTITHLGPGNRTDLNPHCIRRDLAPKSFQTYTSQANLNDALRQVTFGSFQLSTEFTIHRGGHAGPGGIYGDLVDLSSSLTDPLFYLHHTNLDRVWWSWQQKNLTDRLQDISGPIFYQDYNNVQGGNVTLDFELPYGVLTPKPVTVREVMDTQARNLCYTYDKIYV